MSVTFKPSGWRAAAVGTAFALAAGATVIVAAAGDARADDAAFDSYAQGIAISATLRNQSLPLGLVIEGLGPEASSRLNSAGQSDAEAAFPYIGTVVPGLIGIAAGLYGFQAPAYPLQAATGAGDAPVDVAYPGIKLHAESGQESNVGSASLVSESGGGSASSRITVRSSGDVESAAASALDAVVIGGTVRVSGVASTAKVVADSATGKLSRSSSLSIGRIHIPGLALAVPKTSPESAPIPVPFPGVPQLPNTPFPPVPLPFGGQTLPAPDIGFKDGFFSTTLPGFGSTQFAVPAAVVLAAFADAGYAVDYQPAVETPTGVEGASFQVAYTAPGFPENPYFTGPVPLTYTIGKVVASVTLNPVIYGAVGGAAAPGAGAESGVDSAGVGADGNLLPNTDAAFGVTPNLTPGGSVPVAGAPGAAALDAGQTATFLPAALTTSTDLGNIYLAFAGVALAALLSMTALSLLGVRAPWKS